MKTDEEVNKLAYEASYSQYDNIMHPEFVSTMNGFIMGYNEAKKDFEDESDTWTEIRSHLDLPNEYMDVNVYGRFTKDSPKTVYQATFNPKTRKFYSEGVISKNVTHWKYLPKPPQS